jgi:lysozyme
MIAVDIASQIAIPFEGFRARPYKCPAGIWTIGYGTTRYPNGKAVQPAGPPISQEKALEFLTNEMQKSMSSSLKYCPVLSMNDNRLGAITDFVYNLGAGRLQCSTLRRRINQQNWPEVRKELMKWTRGGGKILKGLVLRRSVEVRLI